MLVSSAISSSHQELSPAALNIWHCQDYGRFHLSIRDVCLTFAPTEFDELSQAIVGCYWQYEVSKLATGAILMLPM